MLVTMYKTYFTNVHLYFCQHTFFHFANITTAITTILVKLLGRKKNEKTVTSMQTIQEYLDDGQKVYSCIHCGAHLASQVNLVSKDYSSNRGPVYFFDSVVNIASGPTRPMQLLTGLHHVADIYCQM